MSHLTHAEAAELLPVLVSRTADALDVDALLIKGRAADAHGLRPPQLSADVDVLVEPAGFERLSDALISSGWAGLDEKYFAQPDIVAVKHSVTLRHPLWPIELDLHRNFPGMFASDADAFAALWEDRVMLPLAGHEVAAAGLAGSVVIGLLHAWRSPGEPKAQNEAATIADVLAVADASVRDSVSRIVERTGTGEAGRDRWVALSISPGVGQNADADDLLAWRLRSDAGRQPLALGWILELRRQPLRRRPGVVLKALMGANEYHLRSRYPAAPPGRRGLWVIRWWRLKGVAKDIPRIVGMLRQHRQP